MQGLIGAFLGVLISFLICLLLLNQPGAFTRVPEILNQPIYLLFIIVTTFTGLLAGYFCRGATPGFRKEKKEAEPKTEPGKVIQFEGPMADTIVTVSVIIFGIIAYLESRSACVIYCFVLPIFILWIAYRSGFLSKLSGNSKYVKK